MTSSNPAFLREILRTTPDLFGRILQFNFQPARYLHHERVRSFMDGGLFQRLLSYPCGERHLSERIAAHWKLDSAGFFDFQEPRRRLALLSSESLDRLFRLCALALAGPAISREIRRDEVRAFRQTFSEEDYQFAVKRSGLLIGTLPTELSRSPSAGETLVQHVQGHRRRLIGCCIAEESPSFTSRLLLKLPPADEPSAEDNVTTGEKEAAFRIVQKIARAERLEGQP